MAISSPPIAPPSPAWGLSPAKARRGCSMPKFLVKPRAVARALATTSSIVSSPGTSTSGTCVVIGTTRNDGPASIITALAPAIPQRSATNSVWPG